MPKFFACALIALMIGGGLTTTLVAQPGDLFDPFGGPPAGVPQPVEDPFDVEPAPPRVERIRPQPQAPSETPLMPLAISGTKAALEALEERVDLEFVETPLEEVADFLHRFTQANIHLDVKALEEIGLSPDSPVTFSTKGLPLRSGLRLLLDQFQLTYTLRDGGLQITSREEAENALVTKVYPVGQLLTSRVKHRGFRAQDDWTLQNLSDVIETTVQPKQWDVVGGAASCEEFRQSLAITASLDMHDEIAALLAALEAGVAAAEKSPADPPAVSHLPQIDPKSDEGKIFAALAQPLAVDVTETPLADVLQDIGQRAGIPILLDLRALEEVGIGGDTPVTRRVAGVRLQSALRLILEQMDLTYVVRDGVLLVTTPEMSESKLLVRVLPVGDLVRRVDAHEQLKHFAHAGDYQTLIDVITATIRPTTWEEVGGPGAIEPFRGCLVLAQTAEVLDDIEALIAGLRQMQSQLPPAKKEAQRFPTAPIDLDDLRGDTFAKMRAKLAADVGLHTFVDLPLHDVVDLLQKHCGVELQIDRMALEEVGIGADTPLSAKLGGESLADALHRILRELDLTWTLRHDVILITTKEEMESHPVTRIYAVGDLAKCEDALQSSTHDFAELHEVLTETVFPTTWEEVGGPGVIEEFPLAASLVISQSEEVHERIGALLADLRAAQVKAETETAAARPTGDKEEVITNKAGERLYVKIYQLTSAKPEFAQEIAAAIADLVEPESWKTGEPYVLRAMTSKIIVRHTARAHRAIDALVVELDARAPRGAGGGSYPGPAGGTVHGTSGGIFRAAEPTPAAVE